MFRKTIFWAHLVAGVAAGLVILMMSVTGVLLMYERQILAWSAQSHYVPVEQQGEALPLDQLLFITENEHPELNAGSMVVSNNPGAPVELRAGRAGGIALNPYTGEEMETGSPRLEGFFRALTGWHRWFNVSGEGRDTARAITGASNLLFLFLVISGFYLWFPSVWKWVMFRTRLVFNARATNSKARDWNWHHVFGFWSAIPLVFVVATAAVFNYGWANNLVYQVFGEQPPTRGGPPGGPAGGPDIPAGSAPATVADYLSLDTLFNMAATEAGDWNSISISLPKESADEVSFSIDRGNGGQPHLRHTLSLDRSSGAVSSVEEFSDQSKGRQARSIIRFLHTGEVLGFWGQTIAGLVSFTSILMVWTGLALAWRRLIFPLVRGRRA